MQNQLENIESSKKDLEFTLEAHRGDCGKLQQQIDDIHSEISRLEEESKSRMEQFNQLKAQKDHEANELSQAIQIRVRQVKALREQLDGQLVSDLGCFTNELSTKKISFSEAERTVIASIRADEGTAAERTHRW